MVALKHQGVYVRYHGIPALDSFTNQVSDLRIHPRFYNIAQVVFIDRLETIDREALGISAKLNPSEKKLGRTTSGRRRRHYTLRFTIRRRAAVEVGRDLLVFG